jgi:hypothetical protein
MDRRELLKLIPAMAATPGITLHVLGKEVGKAYEIDPKARYVAVINADAIAPDQFILGGSKVLPPGTPVFFITDQHGIDDVLRIYKVED